MSNPQKSQLKVLIAEDIGADVEDKYERELKSAHMLEGGAEALKQAAFKVPTDLIGKLDQEMEAGAIKDGMPALQVLELVKKYLARAGVYLKHMSDNEQKKVIAQYGRAEGLNDAVKVIAKMRTAESEKLQQALTLVAESDGGPRPTMNQMANAARAERGSAAERKARELERRAGEQVEPEQPETPAEPEQPETPAEPEQPEVPPEPSNSAGPSLKLQVQSPEKTKPKRRRAKKTAKKANA